MDLVLEEPIVDWCLGILGAQDRLLELGQLESELMPHFLGLALIKALRLSDVDDVLQAPIVLVV